MQPRHRPRIAMFQSPSAPQVAFTEGQYLQPRAAFNGWRQHDVPFLVQEVPLARLRHSVGHLHPVHACRSGAAGPAGSRRTHGFGVGRNASVEQHVRWTLSSASGTATLALVQELGGRPLIMFICGARLPGDAEVIVSAGPEAVSTRRRRMDIEVGSVTGPLLSGHPAPRRHPRSHWPRSRCRR